MYVRKNTSQPGKCRSVKPMCQWHIGSVGSACFTGGEPTDAVSACTRLQLRQNACILAKSGFGNKLQPFLTVFYTFVVVPSILSRYTRVESKEKGGLLE